MARPPKQRCVHCLPAASYFKPRGIPMTALAEIELGLDELEALRLADLEGLYQADVAVQMGVSRQTVGNILARAHRKIADALLNGKALRIATPVAARPPATASAQEESIA
ncbi:MAG: hypothetical protein CGU28_07575 [Candidatus Dactylopiibacterium carminicum]|uniref:UPF0251 protein BGI27_05445 n=1 Tax=Candidatus Dactylopiibacterium carminicum TaxID=857335 RepID=A0A272EVN4_9RHOO|nr:DUF134 domain-containing protein [Candidatus Dactylopiibacterium carminicum]KAF7599896.1 DUF134 domain-containing protein [Candidatus Dactylopiibacterium carminicum]PAS94165.1 MAG: hypothetical protein CGU29_04900 [Candidatus Dactylopiibacterium carminicum]PAS96764.1 MAG: hypothetical protein CGU28_07575 [Candidatus Dactylopiibacterium carminicum]PAS99896.1 MAG: hypothetical protein BSR46_05475 [Candidatus Dactylopiibacterium carminicum]